jgi:hypothetical protein
MKRFTVGSSKKSAAMKVKNAERISIPSQSHLAVGCRPNAPIRGRGPCASHSFPRILGRPEFGCVVGVKAPC